MTPTAVRAALRAAAEPARAAALQAYMKSTMPYLRVTAPRLKAALAPVLAGYAFADAARSRSDALALGRGAKFREERYAAIALTGHRGARAFQTLAAFLRPRTRTMRAWSESPDLWKRRTSIISQLQLGGGTDVAHLYACIAPSLASKEFFLRNAIGWALRQYARHDPAEVARYLGAHDAELSGLSKREALKCITPAPGAR